MNDEAAQKGGPVCVLAFSQAVDAHVGGDPRSNQKQHVVHCLTSKRPVRQYEIREAGQSHQACDGQRGVNNVLSETRHGKTRHTGLTTVLRERRHDSIARHEV